MKRLVETTAQAFISVSHEPPSLDPGYLAERAASYAQSLHPASGPAVGSVVQLEAAAGRPPTAEGLNATLEALLASPPTSSADAALVRATAAAATKAMSSVSVSSKLPVVVNVG